MQFVTTPELAHRTGVSRITAWRTCMRHPGLAGLSTKRRGQVITVGLLQPPTWWCSCEMMSGTSRLALRHLVQDCCVSFRYTHSSTLEGTFFACTMG